MNICFQTIISYLFLFVALITIDLGEGQSGCDDQLRCGHHGPAIRFPFRLSSQPEHCGYPGGFTLSCIDRKHTLLELPNSVKLFVKKIDYKSQVIQLYDPDDCFARQLRGLNLSSSPFQFIDSYYLDDFGLFNCSPSETRDYNSHIVSCLSGPAYQVYAFLNDSAITTALISCTKIYALRSIPYNIMRGYDKILQLNWSTPACTHCEVKGKRCLLKNNKSETECGPKINKGIVFYPMNFHLCSLRLQPSMNSFWPILGLT
jgi:hypothetical protein